MLLKLLAALYKFHAHRPGVPQQNNRVKISVCCGLCKSKKILIHYSLQKINELIKQLNIIGASNMLPGAAHAASGAQGHGESCDQAEASGRCATASGSDQTVVNASEDALICDQSEDTGSSGINQSSALRRQPRPKSVVFSQWTTLLDLLEVLPFPFCALCAFQL
jgi:hypothetical protein